MQTLTPPAAAANESLNPKLIVPFVNSTRQVFATMVGVKTTISKPFLKQSLESTYEVCGVIGFSGEIVGSIIISFTNAAARALVKAFAGTDFEPGSPDFCDAIGELANMIAGSAKKDLGALASITVPTVIIGSKQTVAPLSGVPCIVIPCSTPVGDFAVEVNIKPNKH